MQSDAEVVENGHMDRTGTMVTWIYFLNLDSCGTYMGDLSRVGSCSMLLNWIEDLPIAALSHFLPIFL